MAISNLIFNNGTIANKLFSNVNFSVFLENYKNGIFSRIERMNYEEFSLEQIINSSLLSHITIQDTTKSLSVQMVPARFAPWNTNANTWDGSIPTTVVEVSISFCGNQQLLQCRPSSLTIPAPNGHIKDSKICFYETLWNEEAEKNLKDKVNNNINLIHKFTVELNKQIDIENVNLTNEINELYTKKYKILNRQYELLKTI